MKVQEISIKDIKVVENVRTTVGDVKELMQDIKNRGLRSPIEVAKTNSSDYVLVSGHRRLTACRKLGFDKIHASVCEDMNLGDLLIHNAAENIHRKDIAPVELGRICEKLHKMELAPQEIAVRLSLPLSRINDALRLYRKLPSKYRNRVEYIESDRRVKNGNIPASLAAKIITFKKSYGLSDAATDKLLQSAKVEEMTSADLYIVNMFLKQGLTVAQAIDARKNYEFMRHDIVLDVQEVEARLQKEGIDSTYKLLNGIIYGELKPLKRPDFIPVK